MRRQWVVTLCVVVLSFSSRAGWADDTPVVGLEPVVVTATRLPKSAAETLHSVTTLEREDIERANAQDVFNLLRGAPGFENAQTGGLGTQGGIFLRGTESDHTLVLVDGIRVNRPTDGGAPLNRLLGGSVDRLELVRGNVSSLHGDQAIGGVIQLFTATDRSENGASISGGLGTLRTRKAGVQLDTGTAATRFSLGANHLTTAGFSSVRKREILRERALEQTGELDHAFALTRIEDLDDDTARNTSAHARLSHALSENHQLSISALHTRARTEYDGSFENLERAKTTVVALNSVNAFSERWTSRLTLGEARDDARNFLGDAPARSYDTTSRQLTWQNELHLAPQRTLLAGFEWLRQDVDSTAGYVQSERRVRSPFVGFFMQERAWSAQLSVRHDSYSDVPSTTTGRVSLGYQLAPALRMRAGLATAFKAPGFDDLYFPGASNPSLRPERARSAELGIRYGLDHAAYFDALFFSNRLRDLIAYGAAFTPFNVERARTEGVELAIGKSFGTLQLRAAATLQEAKNLSTGERLTRRARNFGSVSASLPMQRANLRLQVRASDASVDNRFDFSERTRLGGYAVADFYASYDFSDHTRLQASVENLFDKDYELAHGYNARPRTLLVELTHRFR